MKAIALFSGGLDSTLAIKLVKDQGIDVVAININTGFGSTKERLTHMQNMCDQVGVEFKTIDIQSEYLQDVLFDPKHGYGKHFNPCIDCHAKMFAVAKRVMEAEGASFLISGEVLGQRPMSQNKNALQTVLNESNCDGLLLRPLSAKRLAPTLAEENGWIDREKLGDIFGRSRKRQLELVKEYGLKDYESPGGGCLLTEESFAKKMVDFIKYDRFEIQDIPVMKHGRHLRLPDGAKLVVGRDKNDNAALEAIENEKFLHLKTLEMNGPHGLLSKNATEADKELAAKIMLTYTKAKENELYSVSFDGAEIQSSPFDSRDALKPYVLFS
ncbi:MAG: 7-cyano-7-deazaguanine synthase [Sulfurimonadaceae bacterium]|nr:7-cyano-7-deazaguanine synthase [Sulfurimonadaceae bacterium]